MQSLEGKPQGFTVLELLLVLCILGVVAGLLAPGLLRAGEESDRSRQQRTVKAMRSTGTAMISWLTDQVGAAAAGRVTTTVNFRDFPEISRANLATILVPTYLREVPALDGWDHPYDYAAGVKNPLARHVLAIRSRGRDGVTEADVYTVEPLDPESFSQDLVWADGFFVRWPSKPEGR
jgi:prepilin-type N-terminal cleavage/methylation domain-containing protein